MKTSSELIRGELSELKRIVKIAYEAESAQGTKSINPHDTVMQVRAAEIILARAGARMRTVLEQRENPGECH